MTTAVNDLRIGSLFSGYGGLDLAVENVFDATTAWVADIDPGPRKILAHRFPHAPNLGDVTAVDWAAVEPVDIIAGGSPCQDVSHAGRRAGFTEGTRSNLWSAMREAIAVIRPKLVVWENVRGVMSAAADSAMEPCPGCVGDRNERPVLRAFGRVLGDLAELGYDAQWHGVRAADVGACHGRWRVFVIAHPRDDGCENLIPRGHATQRSSATGDRDAAGMKLLPTPSAADGNGGGRYGSEGHAMPLPGAVVQLLPTPGANLGDNGGPQHPDKRRAGGHSVSIEDAVHGLNLLPTPTAQAAKHAGDDRGPGTLDDGNLWSVATRADRWGDYAAAIHRHEQILGRPAPPPTEPGRTGNPRLSPRFAEWMMCLPDGWVCDVPGITRNEALKALGNGVVPVQAEAALRHMLGLTSRGS